MQTGHKCSKRTTFRLLFTFILAVCATGLSSSVLPKMTCDLPLTPSGFQHISTSIALHVIIMICCSDPNLLKKLLWGKQLLGQSHVFFQTLTRWCKLLCGGFTHYSTRSQLSYTNTFPITATFIMLTLNITTASQWPVDPVLIFVFLHIATHQQVVHRQP